MYRDTKLWQYVTRIFKSVLRNPDENKKADDDNTGQFHIDPFGVWCHEHGN